MKVLITGGAGFIGSNLSELLLSLGHEVKVIDDFSTGKIENITHLQENSNFELTTGSVTDLELMDDMVVWCDHCYHLAAPVGVKYIMENPVHAILGNIRGVDIVLETVNRHKKRVMLASTSEIYGKSLDFLDPTHKRKLKETDYRIEGSTRNHRWAYANTKAMDEFLAFAYHKEFNTEVVVVRFFNTVGPRQISEFGMVIPNFVQRALAGEDLVVFGSGEQRRSFMHVQDAIRAVTGLMITGKGVGEEFNVGNPNELTINELAQKVIDRSGSKSKLVHIPYEKAYGSGFEDMNRRTADITKLTETLGFEMVHDLDSILDDVIAYYREKDIA